MRTLHKRTGNVAVGLSIKNFSIKTIVNAGDNRFIRTIVSTFEQLNEELTTRNYVSKLTNIFRNLSFLLTGNNKYI